MNLSAIDAGIIAVYLAAVIAVGFVVKRQSAQGIESYFLGNRQLPWWMLAMSGSSSYFDITGTMWIVSILVVLGIKAMWIQFVWGFVIAAFYMAYMGKWIRRSGVITGAEWMVKRFGGGIQGDMARLSYTLYAIVTISAFLGYTAVGMGKFGSEFLPLPNEHACAAVIIGVTGLYVVVGGFRGLTLVEFFQTIVLTLGALMIAYLGWDAMGRGHMASPPPADWYSIWPRWTLERNLPSGSIYSLAPDSMYYLFGAVVITYVAKGLLLCISGPEQLYDFQKFLAVRTPREASLMGMLWGVFHTVRFPMAAGVAALAMVGFSAEPQLLQKITTDPEKVLPIVIAHSLPAGLKGLALAALISAFMGTFSAMVNGGASYLVRDVYQRYLNPRASDRQLVKASYVSSVLLIATGILISMFAGSINTVFTWIMATLGAGVLLPNVLRWYWSRLNGWGYFGGTASGMLLSLVQAVAQSRGMLAYPVYVTFPALALVVLVICVAVTLATPPTDRQTLISFYRDVRPFGAWGSVAREVRQGDTSPAGDSAWSDIANVCLAVPWLMALYSAPVFLVVRQTHQAAAAALVAALLSAVLYFSWWKNLPQQ